MSCHASDQPKNGPASSQTAVSKHTPMKTDGFPVTRAVLSASALNVFVAIIIPLRFWHLEQPTQTVWFRDTKDEPTVYFGPLTSNIPESHSVRVRGPFRGPFCAREPQFLSDVYSNRRAD